MAILNQLERKIGWIAVPGLIRIIMSFQVLVWVLLVIQQAKSGSGPTEISNYDEFVASLPGMMQMLYLSIEKVFGGEVWRLVSFVFLPPTMSGMGIIIMFFAFYFTCFIGDLLENTWGSFRTTLYVLGYIIGTLLGALLVYQVDRFEFGAYLAFGNGRLIFISVLLGAAAVYAPHFEIRIFGIIPVKMMWLAIIDAGLVAIEVLRFAPRAPHLSLAILLSVGVFFVVFGPGMRKALKTRGEVAVRRRRFEAAKATAGMAMHECASCGKTENDDPDLEFRVSADGEEYCDVCRAKAADAAD